MCEALYGQMALNGAAHFFSVSKAFDTCSHSDYDILTYKDFETIHDTLSHSDY